MLKLAQQRMRDIGRHVAAAGAFPDLGGKSLGNGGGQLLSAGRFTHIAIIPTVGSKNSATLGPSRLRHRPHDTGAKRGNPPNARGSHVALNATWEPPTLQAGSGFRCRSAP